MREYISWFRDVSELKISGSVESFTIPEKRNKKFQQFPLGDTDFECWKPQKCPRGGGRGVRIGQKDKRKLKEALNENTNDLIFFSL